MTQKKSSNWYIATTHYLTAGFAIPFIIGLLISFLIAPIIPTSILTVLLFIIKLLSLWLGIIYSANYLKKAYIIENKDKIVNLSTIYIIILNLGYLLVLIINNKYTNGEFVLMVIEMVITIVFFYILSKKYIKNTETLKA